MTDANIFLIEWYVYEYCYYLRRYNYFGVEKGVERTRTLCKCIIDCPRLRTCIKISTVRCSPAGVQFRGDVMLRENLL